MYVFSTCICRHIRYAYICICVYVCKYVCNYVLHGRVCMCLWVAESGNRPPLCGYECMSILQLARSLSLSLSLSVAQIAAHLDCSSLLHTHPTELLRFRLAQKMTEDRRRHREDILRRLNDLTATRTQRVNRFRAFMSADPRYNLPPTRAPPLHWDAEEYIGWNWCRSCLSWSHIQVSCEPSTRRSIQHLLNQLVLYRS